jgi:hypothetical protein
VSHFVLAEIQLFGWHENDAEIFYLEYVQKKLKALVGIAVLTKMPTENSSLSIGKIGCKSAYGEHTVSVQGVVGIM